jgi:hypothetical protein
MNRNGLPNWKGICHAGHNNLSRDMQDYINRYHLFIRESSKKYVLRAKNKTKAMWHVINKEVGKSLKHDKKLNYTLGLI